MIRMSDALAIAKTLTSRSAIDYRPLRLSAGLGDEPKAVEFSADHSMRYWVANINMQVWSALLEAERQGLPVPHDPFGVIAPRYLFPEQWTSPAGFVPGVDAFDLSQSYVPDTFAEMDG